MTGVELIGSFAVCWVVGWAFGKVLLVFDQFMKGST